MKSLIFVIVAGTIAATGEAALADQLDLQTEVSGMPNPQLTNRKPQNLTMATHEFSEKTVEEFAKNGMGLKI
jgi:hypothetical protein